MSRSASPQFKAEADAAYNQVILELPRLDAALLQDTQFFAGYEPPANWMQDIKPGYVMLGLYTSPPPTIYLWEAPIRQVGKSALEVLRHEAGHRLMYDHQLDDILHRCGVDCMAEVGAQAAALTDIPSGYPIQSGGIRARARRSAPQLEWIGASAGCPVCETHELLAEAKSLMEGLSIYTTIQQRVPDGLGGTIPLAKDKVRQAELLIPQVAAVLPERQSEIQQLARCLREAQAQLSGTLDIPGVNDAAFKVNQCWNWAFWLAWAAYNRSLPLRI